MSEDSRSAFALSAFAFVIGSMPAHATELKRWTWPQIKDLVVAAGTRWGADNVSRLAAAFAFYAILSLAPILVFAVVGAGLFYGQRINALHALIEQTRSALGDQAAMLVSEMIHSAMNGRAGTAAAILSLIVTFFSASNLFLQLDEAIKTIWNVKATGSAIRNIVMSRIVAFGCVLAFGGGVVAWLGFDSWMSWVEKQAGGNQAFVGVSFFSTAGLLTVAFACVFKALPNNRAAWRDVWPGALVAAFGVASAKQLLTFYFASAHVSAAYGSAGALVVILLWFYYTAQIFFFGVEFTYVYATQYGSLRAPPY